MVPPYPAVLRAPVFAPDRAPGEAGGGGVGAASAAQPFAVIGVGLGGRTATAVAKGADGTTHVLQPGQSLLGWRLVEVTPTTASFVGPTGRVNVIVGAPIPPIAAPSPSPSPAVNASEPAP